MPSPRSPKCPSSCVRPCGGLGRISSTHRIATVEWTVRQLVHHIADSHMVAFHRVRRALTEDWPEVHGYKEASFATLHDVAGPIEWSLEIIEAVHARWGMLLQSMTDEQWDRGIRHAERGKMGLEFITMLYAWHSKHHVAHITHLRQRLGW